MENAIRFIPTRNPYIVTDSKNKQFLMMPHNVLCQFLRSKNILTDENQDDAYKDFEEFLKKVRGIYGIPVLRMDTFIEYNMFIERFEFSCGDHKFNSIIECVKFCRESGLTKSINDNYIASMIIKAIKENKQLYGCSWNSKTYYVKNLTDYKMVFKEKID